MVYSMTGFGSSVKEIGQRTFQFEVRSLNGKTTDIRLKSSINLRDRELALRRLVMELGLRGKFDVNLSMSSGDVTDTAINTDLLERYYSDLMAFSAKHNIATGDILQSLVRLPNVIQVGDEAISNEDWALMEEMIREAMEKLNNFRRTEGASLENDLRQRVTSIIGALEEVGPFELDRIISIKNRIKKNLKQHMAEETIDENRFEQELLFYLEKLDINEEKVRLTQHCKYFLEQLDASNIQKGKKMSFISQEMGREINTLGAKAQHSEIQQLVVRMKDELEKIKEQILNTL